MNVVTQIFDRFIGQVCIEILRCGSESMSMKVSDLIMAFKCMTGQALNILHLNLLPVSKLANNSEQPRAKHPSFRTASGQRTFYFRTVKLWNNLESFLKLSPSAEIFKRSLRSQLLDNFVNTSQLSLKHLQLVIS